MLEDSVGAIHVTDDGEDSAGAIHVTDDGEEWVKTDEAMIAKVAIPKEVVAPAPPPVYPPTPYTPPPSAPKKKAEGPVPEVVIGDFLERHKRLKGIFDTKGCAAKEVLITESGIDEDEMKLHEQLFISDGYSASIAEMQMCNIDTIKCLIVKLNHLSL